MVRVWEETTGVEGLLRYTRIVSLSVSCFLGLFGLKSSYTSFYYLIIAFRASPTSLAGIMNGEEIGTSKTKAWLECEVLGKKLSSSKIVQKREDQGV